MDSRQHRHGRGAGAGPAPAVIVAALALAATGVAEVALHAAERLDGTAAATWNPLVLLIDLARGRARWPTLATVLAGILVVLFVAATVALSRRRTGPRHPDRAARLMGTGRDLEPVTGRAMRRKAKDRFGVEQPGLPIARAVAGGQTLYATWEDMQFDIWGHPAKARAPGRSRRCSPRPARRLRPPTSPTSTPPPAAPRTARPGVELRSGGDRRRRGGLVVEPAQLRHLRPPRAGADRRVRRRLPRPRRAP